MGEEGIDLARIRSEIGLGQHLATVVARYLLEQAFELLDVAVNRLAELRRAAIFAANILERLLTLRRVKPAREGVLFAALIAIPQFDRRIVIDETRDVDRERIERVDCAHGRIGTSREGGGRGRVAANGTLILHFVAVALGASKHIADPAASALFVP